ncbi:MAG TPA: outer membrane beta-barrel protein [Steroidobacteraceae bacterium]|nr:outer membrane beta-barrel protein [Steroidobacteraceae bacterium]
MLITAAGTRHGRMSRCACLRAALVLCAMFDLGSTALADSGPADGCASGSESTSFWKRLSESYKKHLFPGDQPAPVPDANAPFDEEAAGYRKDLPPPPVSNPPWPYTVYPEGGTELIGYENLYSSALMDAIYCGEHGKAWKDSRFTIYGWLEPGGNFSTSNLGFNKLSGTGGNFPAAYSYEPDTIQLDQAAVYFERTPDEIQRDHFDWGFRITWLYGTDYKYTFSNGILSWQYTDRERLYGWDPVMYYMDFYFPHFFEGENLRVGRYISIPDIEAQLAPNNLTYSHSLLYTYDPYTQNGIVSTTMLNRNWKVQLEISAGNDLSPTDTQFRQWTPAACIIYTTTSGNDAIYPCMNGLNNQNFGWNNVQHAVTTWYHKINDHWHTDTEAWYMWENHTPDVLNPQGAAILAHMFPTPDFNIGAPDGAQCNNTALVYCASHEWAIVNYLNYEHDPHNIWVWRTDYLNDTTGQRTGFKGSFGEVDLGYTHWVGDVIELRPEIRLERELTAPNAAITGFAYDNPCYAPANPASPACTFSSGGRTLTFRQNGGKRSQAMFAMDAIFHF